MIIPIAARAESAFDLEPGTHVLAPIAYQQLAVFPIVKDGAQPVTTSRYLTLAEGLKDKLVDVSEDRDGAQVNQVTVRNRSSKPLLLLGGEVILGGQQDRIIGQDTVVEAKNDAPVQVFCVEHGRWAGHGEFGATGGLAEGRVRMSAKFKEDQSAVWDEVAQRTSSLDATSATGTYRTLAVGKEGEKAIKPFKDHVVAELDRLPDTKHLVGLAAAINGRIVSVDVFASPGLFNAYRDGLLRSIFMSAAATAPAEAAPAPRPAAVGAFVKQAEEAKEQTLGTAGKARTAMKKAEDVARSAVMEKDGEGESAVYRSYQAQ